MTDLGTDLYSRADAATQRVRDVACLFADHLDQANRFRHRAFDAQRYADFYASQKHHRDADDTTELVQVVALLTKRHPAIDDMAQTLIRYGEQIRDWHEAAREQARAAITPMELP